MKRFLAALVAVAALLTGALVSTAPASAYIADPMINGYKFASTNICVGSALNQTTYPVGAMAQQWNLKTGTDVLHLDFSTNCALDGYSPSKRMVVGTYSGGVGADCVALTNQYHDSYNGFWRWTQGPGAYLNTSDPICVGSQARRNHWISLAIGWHLGLVNFDSAGWNSHVMNMTDWSVDNVPSATAGEGQKVREIYLGVFCDSGTVC